MMATREQPAIKRALREAFRYGAIWGSRDKSLDTAADRDESKCFRVWYCRCDPMLEIRHEQKME